jgi:putative sigma-54 modulation protein
MRVEIHTSSFSLTESLRTYIERRLHFAFGWADHHLQRVTLRLTDINGPKGGLDKSCRLHIGIAGSNPVVIEEIQADAYVAIDRAIERAGRTITRRLQRSRHLRQLGSDSLSGAGLDYA